MGGMVSGTEGRDASRAQTKRRMPYTSGDMSADDDNTPPRIYRDLPN